jgi:hypothetical protein
MAVSSQREIQRAIRRLRRGERSTPLVRWPVLLCAVLALLAARLLAPRSGGGPVALTPHSPAEIARQRAQFAQQLYRDLTPLQRSTLDRMEAVVIPHAGLTPQQRKRAWQLAAVRGAQFPFHKVSRITAVLQRMPAGDELAAEEMRCVVRVEFASENSAVAYTGIVPPSG